MGYWDDSIGAGDGEEIEFYDDSPYETKEWEVDQIRDNLGWTCTIYHNNSKLFMTGPCPKLTSAKMQMEEFIDKLVDSKAKNKPLTTTDVKWNRPDDLVSRMKEKDIVSKVVAGFSGPGIYTGTNYPTYVHCDHDPTDKKNLVFSINKVSVLGATKSLIKVQTPGEKRLIINCSGMSVLPYVSPVDDKPVSNTPIKSVPASMTEFLAKDYRYVMPPPPPVDLPDFGDELLLDWDDAKVAPVHPVFWIDLAAFIKSKAFPYKKIVFCCFGGHGRTGTGIAALALAAGIYNKAELEFEKGQEFEPTLAQRAMICTRSEYCHKKITWNFLENFSMKSKLEIKPQEPYVYTSVYDDNNVLIEDENGKPYKWMYLRGHGKLGFRLTGLIELITNPEGSIVGYYNSSLGDKPSIVTIAKNSVPEATQQIFKKRFKSKLKIEENDTSFVLGLVNYFYQLITRYEQECKHLLTNLDNEHPWDTAKCTGCGQDVDTNLVFANLVEQLAVVNEQLWLFRALNKSKKALAPAQENGNAKTE
jgi:hypothetical protein